MKTNRVAPSDLLTPIVMLLQRSGMSLEQLRDEFDRAARRALRSKSNLRVEKIEQTFACANIVDRWLRHPLFVNSAGRPKDLPLTGKSSIASLFKSAGISGSPDSLLKVLIQYGNVKKTDGGTYRLLYRYMQFLNQDYLPFEPNFQLLVDATTVATRGLARKNKGPQLYFFSVERRDISPKFVAEFISYTHEKALLFAHEINDWLEEHGGVSSKSKGKASKPKRLGMALFPICSDP
jgi:hypothetical protein